MRYSIQWSKTCSAVIALTSKRSLDVEILCPALGKDLRLPLLVIKVGYWIGKVRNSIRVIHSRYICP